MEGYGIDWVLTDRSPKQIQPGDRITRNGRLVRVKDVTINRRENLWIAKFEDGTVLDVESAHEDGLEYTILRPRRAAQVG